MGIQYPFRSILIEFHNSIYRMGAEFFFFPTGRGRMMTGWLIVCWNAVRTLAAKAAYRKYQE